ncbi:hypothetical protein P7K49_025835 [Saguinus oedipus]|uniref:Uncharacterized protein n=1 Tax=Saguinus oedipus TaxID=9490 RepID=A0ABQ9UIT0_SAGOE|nr:hypothetical protein P7K49_025835 [Saguinus oedipus]
MARPGCWGGTPGYAAPSPAQEPPAVPGALGDPHAPPPGAPHPLPVGPPGRSPRLTAGRSVRAASRVAASAPGPRTLRPGPELPPAGRGRTHGRRREGGGRGRGERGAQTIQGAARRGGRGERGRADQAGNTPRKGPGSCPRPEAPPKSGPATPLTAAPAPATPALLGPQLPEHRPLMSFPDLPTLPARPAGARDLTHGPPPGSAAEVGRVPRR